MVRVSRRGKENHFVSITSAKATDLGLSQDAEARYSTVKVYLPHHHMTQDKPMLTHARSQRPCRKQQEKYKRARHWFPLLPFQQFQVLFNSLFKVLCIFPSRYFCAIGLPPVFSFRWSLPPVRAALPSNSTRCLRSIRRKAPSTDGTVTLYRVLFQETSPGAASGHPAVDYNSVDRNNHTDLHYELRPVQSPLLRPSQLVSFPPLSYMLKFSGSSHSIGGLIQSCSRFARTARTRRPVRNAQR